MKTVLWVSPTMPLPVNAGNRRHLDSLITLFENDNWKIDFLLFGWEWEAKNHKDKLEKRFSNFINIPNSFNRSLSESNKEYWKIDDWITDQLKEQVERLSKEKNYQVIIVEYVWMSGVLEQLPKNILKIINCHDVFTDRDILLKEQNIDDLWYFTREQEEAKGLSRCDIAIGITESECIFYTNLIKKYIDSPSVRVIHSRTGIHSINPPFVKSKVDQNKIIIGYMGSGNSLNRVAIARFLERMNNLGDTRNFITIRIAGSVCDYIKDYNNICIVKEGFVHSQIDFYNEVDLIIAPMINGTGLKIKTIEAISYAKPFIATASATNDIPVKVLWHNFITPEMMANMFFSIFANNKDLKIKILKYLQEESIKIQKKLIKDRLQFEKSFLKIINEKIEKKIGGQLINKVKIKKVIKVFFFPDYSSSNPYQKLLYSDCPKNISIQAGDINDALDEVSNNDVVTFFHLHWINPIYAGSKNDEDALIKIKAFVSKLEEFISSGGKLIWTIHNLLEHDRKFLQPEIFFRKKLSTLSYRIHVHSKSSIKEILNIVAIDHRKIAVIEHGNYFGFYSDSINREFARSYFGFEKDDIVFLVIGQIRPYKGLDSIIDSYIQLKGLYKVKLLIAGKIVHPYNQRLIERSLKVDSSIRIYSQEIADKELQIFFRAADCAIFSYKNILTSGSLHLAETFDCPVIAPDFSYIKEFVNKNKNGFLYDSKNPRAGLFQAMSSFCSLTIPQKTDLFEICRLSKRINSWSGAVNKLFAIEGQPSSQVISEHEHEYESKYQVLDSQTVKCDFYKSNPQWCSDRDKVAILILNYNCIDDIIELICSIRKNKFKNFHIIVIDNASDNLIMKDFILNEPCITVIVSGENLGYAAGNNIGILYAKEISADYTWIINPDTVVYEDTLMQLINGAHNFPHVHVWGSIIAYYNSPHKIWYGGGVVTLEAGVSVSHLFQHKMVEELKSNVPYETDYITGASLFTKTDFFELAGLIPEDYFLYYEETDWCTRAKAKGYKLYINPQSILLHKESSRSEILPSKYFVYYYLRASVLFRTKFCNFHQKKLIEEVSVLKNNVLSFDKTKYPYQYIHMNKLADKAIEDGFIGRRGKIDLNTILCDQREKKGKIINAEFSILTNGVVEGYACNNYQTSDYFDIYIFIDDNYCGKADIIEFNDSDRPTTQIQCGFKFQYIIPMKFIDGEDHYLQASINIGSINLTPQFFNLKVQPDKIKACIDRVKNNILMGWAVDVNKPQSPVNLDILVDDKVVTSIIANQERHDLMRIGYFSKNAGFSVTLPNKLFNGNDYKFSIKKKGTSTLVTERGLPTTHKPRLFQFNPDSVDSLFSWLFLNREVSIADKPVVEKLLSVLNEKKQLLVAEYGKQDPNTFVSIVMPVFNREHVIEKALESVFNQSYSNWELIVCDDGSTDKTYKIICSFVKKYKGNGTIKLLQNERNLGVSSARNKALSNAQGKYIAYLDSDNYWEKDFLLLMVHSMDLNPKAECCYCGDLVGQYNEDDGRFELLRIRFGAFNKTLLQNCNFIDLNIFMHKALLYKQLGGFREDMSRLVDWELILRYTANSYVMHVPYLLATYLFGSADNQITKTQNYYENSLKVKSTIQSLRTLPPSKMHEISVKCYFKVYIYNMFIVDIMQIESYHKIWSSILGTHEFQIILLGHFSNEVQAHIEHLELKNLQIKEVKNNYLNWIIVDMRYNNFNNSRSILLPSMAIPDFTVIDKFLLLEKSYPNTKSIIPSYFSKRLLNKFQNDGYYISPDPKFDFDVSSIHCQEISGKMLNDGDFFIKGVNSFELPIYITKSGLNAIKLVKSSFIESGQIEDNFNKLLEDSIYTQNIYFTEA